MEMPNTSRGLFLAEGDKQNVFERGESCFSNARDLCDVPSIDVEEAEEELVGQRDRLYLAGAEFFDL